MRAHAAGWHAGHTLCETMLIYTSARSSLCYHPVKKPFENSRRGNVALTLLVLVLQGYLQGGSAEVRKEGGGRGPGSGQLWAVNGPDNRQMPQLLAAESAAQY